MSSIVHALILSARFSFLRRLVHLCKRLEANRPIYHAHYRLSSAFPSCQSPVHSPSCPSCPSQQQQYHGHEACASSSDHLSGDFGPPSAPGTRRCEELEHCMSGCTRSREGGYGTRCLLCLLTTNILLFVSLAACALSRPCRCRVDAAKVHGALAVDSGLFQARHPIDTPPPRQPRAPRAESPAESRAWRELSGTLLCGTDDSRAVEQKIPGRR